MMSIRHDEIMALLTTVNEPLTAREIADRTPSLGRAEDVAKALYWMGKKGLVKSRVTASGRMGYLVQTRANEAPPDEAPPPAVTEADEDSLSPWLAPQGKSRSVKTLAEQLRQLQREAGVREMEPESDLEGPRPVTADDSAPPTDRARRVDWGMEGDPIMRKLAEGCRAVKGALTHARRLRALAAWELLDDEISAWLEELAYDLERLA